MATDRIRKACQIHSSQWCPWDEHKPVAPENSVVHTEARQEFFPGVLIKKTVCGVGNSIFHHSLTEGTQVSFIGLFPIVMLWVKASWRRGWVGGREVGWAVWYGRGPQLSTIAILGYLTCIWRVNRFNNYISSRKPPEMLSPSSMFQETLGGRWLTLCSLAKCPLGQLSPGLYSTV